MASTSASSARLTATVPVESSSWTTTRWCTHGVDVRVMAAVALVVYDRLGLMILKRTWSKVDLLWAGALVVARVITLIL